MNDLTLHQHQTSKLKTNRENELIASTEADFMSISFSPGLKYMHAEWLKPVSSAEFRQALRMLVRSVAFLRAELVLIDITAMETPSLEDQNWTATFMKEAFAKLSVKRSAKVICSTGLQQLAIQNFTNKAGNLPYARDVFFDKEKAKEWLFSGIQNGHPTGMDSIKIPLNFNLKLLRQNGLPNISKEDTTTKQAHAITKLQPAATLPKQLQFRTDFVSISIDHAYNLMNIYWIKSPVSRQYRYGMLKAGRALKEHKLERVLLNNQRLGMLTLEDQGWLVSTSIKVLPSTNLTRLAVVTSADALQQMSSETIGCKLKEAQLPYMARYFLSEEEAIEWLMHNENGD